MLDVDELQRGRDFYLRRMWTNACNAFSLADDVAPLSAEDLVLWAWSSYLSGRDEEFARAMGRAHRVHVDAGEPLPAARCAFWLAMHLLLRGESGPGTGWLGRAARLVERAERDCVERGYLLVPTAFQSADDGDYNAWHAAAVEAVEIGERFGDADLTALALHLQGRALVRQGRVNEGLALLDEAMISVTGGELSPVVTGIVYCSVIEACQEVYALRRSREWTAALARWCDGQPDLVPYAGQCLVHRAEVLQLGGAWREALDEARRACERLSGQPAVGGAFYLQGELHRLRGEFAKAEEAYRQASQWGREPQPGLALLRLSEGQVDAALTVIRRVLDEARDRISRSHLLPAAVEIMLAATEVGAARAAADELADVADGLGAPFLQAVSAHATGAVLLAESDAAAALSVLRRAWSAWRVIGAPYEAARVRVLVGLACRSVGDEDGAAMELDAAGMVFRQLGAAPDLARVRRLSRPRQAHAAAGLTSREREVLALIAAGKTNREISVALVISEHTVGRHVQNIFSKLGVSSRTAAAAYAFGHHLV